MLAKKVVSAKMSSHNVRLLLQTVNWVANTMEEIIYRPIGVIRSKYKDSEGTPIQTTGAKGVGKLGYE